MKFQHWTPFEVYHGVQKYDHTIAHKAPFLVLIEGEVWMLEDDDSLSEVKRFYRDRGHTAIDVIVTNMLFRVIQKL